MKLSVFVSSVLRDVMAAPHQPFGIDIHFDLGLSTVENSKEEQCLEVNGSSLNRIKFSIRIE
jgi:hypothetical protein